MMRSTLLALVVLAGCEGDVDLTGIYEITEHVGSAPCGNDMPVVMPVAYLKFHKEKFIADYFAFDECKDAAGTDCPGGGGLLSGLFEPIDDGWKGVATTSSGSNGRCILGYLETTAKLNGSHITVESSRYSDDTDRSDAECTTDKAEELGKKMPCEEHERLEGEKR